MFLLELKGSGLQPAGASETQRSITLDGNAGQVENDEGLRQL
jgi:hypothetical protein